MCSIHGPEDATGFALGEMSVGFYFHSVKRFNIFWTRDWILPSVSRSFLSFVLFRRNLLLLLAKSRSRTGSINCSYI